MFNAQIYENSGPDGVSVLEVLVQDTDNGPRLFVPLKQTDLAGEIVGPLATLRLKQTYGYTLVECSNTLEAVYRFPMPGDAAVTGVVVRFGDVEIRAELKERAAAEHDYARAMREGRQATLATRESPDVFTLRVAGLQPNQDVTVETEYVQLARADGLDWTLRIPLTTAPRYVRADEAESPHAAGQPLLIMRDPGHRFTLNLTLNDCEHVVSTTHRLDVTTQEAQRLRVRLAEGAVLPDRDCLLTWRLLQEQSRPGLAVWLYDDRQSEHVYFLAQLAPPAATSAPTVPREVVLLVDHSGSMEGAKWQAADWAVMKFLSDLNPHDAFALGLFHNKTRWFNGHKLNTATPETIEQAIRFVQQHTDSGGTELGVALEQALNHEPLPGERARHVVIVTDAEVTDAGRILRLADTEAGKARRRRISVICIDAAPNAFLVNELAERGRGMAKFLTSDPTEEDIATALDGVLESFRQPVLADLRLEIDRTGAQSAGHGLSTGRHADTTSIDIGDLPRGRAIWAVGRVPRGDRNALNFTVTVGGRDAATYQADLGQPGQFRPALKALFGAHRVLALETLLTAHYERDSIADQLKRLGYDTMMVWKDLQNRPATIYAENEPYSSTEFAQAALKQLLCREALDYGLASSATAFVACRMEAGKIVEASLAIPNAQPAGWSDDQDAGFMDFAPPASAPSGGLSAPNGGLSAPSGGFTYASRDMTGSASPRVDPARMAQVMAMYGAFGDPGAPTAQPRRAPSLAGQIFNKFFRIAHSTTSQSEAAQPGAKQQLGFSGIPIFANGMATLTDTSRLQDADSLPEDILLTGITVRFPPQATDPNTIKPDVLLLLYVDDLAAPRARINLADLIKQRGNRPLNVRRRHRQVVKLVLVDPSGALEAGRVRLAILFDHM